MSTEIRRICTKFLRELESNQQQRRRHNNEHTLSFCNSNIVGLPVLNKKSLTITYADAQYLVQFVQLRASWIDWVWFPDTFESEQVVHYIRDGLADTSVRVGVAVREETICLDLETVPYFSALTQLANDLSLVIPRFGEDAVEHTVDQILRGGTHNFDKLFLLYREPQQDRVSFSPLARLVERSSVKEIVIRFGGVRTVPIQEQLQPLCHVLCQKQQQQQQVPSSLQKITLDCFEYGQCHAFQDTQVIKVADMFRKVLTTNTTLTDIQFEHGSCWLSAATRKYVDVHLRPLLHRNQQVRCVSKAASIAQDHFRACSDFVEYMEEHCPDFVTAPDLTASFLALRHVLIGRDGEADPLVLRVAENLGYSCE